ncbi:uncharacterized protein LOC142228881 [Haematobia irritans]|uniref:uncharacterized protein LOC142228881 n=1 Tax=Haematobia irritans TaxID=7368 RepID=UPI003F50788D
MDMQAVKLVPQLNASSAYYKMKLQVHNNFVWDETDGSLVASVFVTCIIKHLRNFVAYCPEIHHIIIYSDGCFYQNRNVTFSNALPTFCMETNISIEQKYIVSGHTQMECDSTHTLIERKVRRKQIYLPSQFTELIKEARQSRSSLKAHQLHYDFFLDFESIPKRYTSIRPGRSSGDPTFNKLRALGYDNSGSLYYKTDICAEYEILPQRRATTYKSAQPSPLYSNKIELSKKKWDHLQDLKNLLPKDCHHFYEQLPYKMISNTHVHTYIKFCSQGENSYGLLQFRLKSKIVVVT